MSTDNPETSQAASKFAEFSFRELQLVAATATEIQETVNTLPEDVSIGEVILSTEIDARTQALARAAGSLAIAETDSPEREEALDDFKIAMEALGLSSLLVSAVGGELYERFKGQRVKLGLTQKQVADQMGVTPAYISRIESGERKTAVTDARLAAFIDSGQFDLIPRE